MQKKKQNIIVYIYKEPAWSSLCALHTRLWLQQFSASVGAPPHLIPHIFFFVKSSCSNGKYGRDENIQTRGSFKFNSDFMSSSDTNSPSTHMLCSEIFSLVLFLERATRMSWNWKGHKMFITKNWSTFQELKNHAHKSHNPYHNLLLGTHLSLSGVHHSLCLAKAPEVHLELCICHWNLQQRDDSAFSSFDLLKEHLQQCPCYGKGLEHDEV